ncbi:MAG: hypothetical protein U1F67_20930 [Rubrivivax sp.]
MPAPRRGARLGRWLRVLTHCNAGWLATCAWGTATAPIYQAHAAGLALEVGGRDAPAQPGREPHRVGVGARAGVPHRVIADNAGGLLMQRGEGPW